MAIGGGYLIVGIACFALIMIANVVLMNVSRVVEEYSKYISIFIEVDKNGGVKKLSKWLNEQGYTTSSLAKSKEKTLNSSDVALIVDVDFDKKRSHREFLTELNELDFVSYVEEI